MTTDNKSPGTLTTDIFAYFLIKMSFFEFYGDSEKHINALTIAKRFQPSGFTLVAFELLRLQENSYRKSLTQAESRKLLILAAK